MANFDSESVKAKILEIDNKVPSNYGVIQEFVTF